MQLNHKAAPHNAHNTVANVGAGMGTCRHAMKAIRKEVLWTLQLKQEERAHNSVYARKKYAKGTREP